MVDWKKLNTELQADKERFYIILSGDKGFKSDNFVTAIVNDVVTPIRAAELFQLVSDKFLTTAKKDYKEIKVVTGDNSGTDNIAIDYAMHNDYDVLKYEADWEGKGNKAGFQRNEDMFTRVGGRAHKGAIIFWDGEDYMTRNLIYQAYNYCVPLRVYCYTAKRCLTAKEILQIQEDERAKQAKFMRV